ncbi:hypothetical protein [Nocardia jiangxiensis]|uniref:hypothetical protein n=1 Tax=Nocardia jiangxiensis TaxID=282685 RepID=UPI0002E6FF11|nr:hypothetical protein [Nocardia jiangxiensis]
MMPAKADTPLAFTRRADHWLLLGDVGTGSIDHGSAPDSQITPLTESAGLGRKEAR